MKKKQIEEAIEIARQNEREETEKYMLALFLGILRIPFLSRSIDAEAAPGLIKAIRERDARIMKGEITDVQEHSSS